MISRRLERDSLPLYYPWKFWILLSWQRGCLFLPRKRNSCVIVQSHEEVWNSPKQKEFIRSAWTLNWSEEHGMMKLNHGTPTRILSHPLMILLSLSSFSFPGPLQCRTFQHTMIRWGLWALALQLKGPPWILTRPIIRSSIKSLC